MVALLAPSIALACEGRSPRSSEAGGSGKDWRILSRADLPSICNESLDIAAHLESLALLKDAACVIVLREAALLAAALLVARERMTVLLALRLLADNGVTVGSLLDSIAVAALLRLEYREFGAASDLSSFKGAPRSWTWLHWRASAASLAVVSRGHTLIARRLRPEPRMAHITNFLTAAECAHVISLGVSSGAMHPSRVVNHALVGDTGVRSDARTSESGRVSAADDKVIMRCVQRAAFLSGLTPAHAEAVQVVHYLPGQQYRPHHDYFQPTDPRYNDKTAERGNRLLSFFVYLSGCDGGGRTYFPTLRVGFAPEVGCAVMWYNMDRHGNPDERTLHAGEPVQSGEKWGMNIWLRERGRASRVAGGKRGLVRASLSLAPSSPCVAAEGSNGDAKAVDVGDATAAARPPEGAAADPRAQETSASASAVAVRLKLVVKPAPRKPNCILPCGQCGDDMGPVGLCLCRDKYDI